MATPFVAGVAALMLHANPGLTPSQIAQILSSTAIDWNDIPGQDNDFGHGLIDALAAVAAAAGSPGPINPVPQNMTGTAVVPDNGEVLVDFQVDAAMLGKPVAVTLTLDGAFVCTLRLGRTCFAGAWSPDLDAEILAPNGQAMNDYETWSICPLAYECGLLGRQETMHFVPSVEGLYRIRVYTFDGAGGSFGYQITRGPAVVLPSADAGADINATADATGFAQVTLDGSASTGAAPLSYEWSEGTTVLGTGVSMTLSFPVGAHTVALVVTDGTGLTAADTVVVTVASASKPKGRPPR